ncbi:MAG: CapA family protein [Gemmatimonadetes bacterium]|jgi:hypothetical protein|nr:CapA family protein [Gemmatimonadota bacterium]MBT5055926.1 CapA family protein [Gemmatimonadota bacterium]MBT5143151.1 CapA family protein [Gemmatimonadota bacterium]MBT5588451.1 CapA family protein [Gemmatimonadota bacterium]MBT5964825.1 CapA family protein [Gemmatimonadota bacterium]
MSRSVQLAFAGDTALGGSLDGIPVGELTRRTGSVQALFADADQRFLSFDCAIGRQGESVYPEEYVIDCDEGSLALLSEWGIDVVSLANNHSTDRGLPALLQGRQSLRARGIGVIGAGQDDAEASSCWITQCHGMKIGWLAFASSDPWVGAYPSSADRAGVAELNQARVLAAVAAARGAVDALIVSLHWGKEYIRVPPPQNVQFARQLIDAGVRVVVGHHPHVIQPVESYGRGVICYSLGNFLFPDYPDQGLQFRGTANESLLVTLEVDTESATIKSLSPVCCDLDGALQLLPAERRDQIMHSLSTTCEILGSLAGEKAWQREVRRFEIARLRRVLREEVVDAGVRAGTSRLLRLGRKNLRSLGRSLGEIIGGGQR